jgi:hypothetical protein
MSDEKDDEPLTKKAKKGVDLDAEWAKQAKDARLNAGYWKSLATFVKKHPDEPLPIHRLYHDGHIMEVKCGPPIKYLVTGRQYLQFVDVPLVLAPDHPFTLFDKDWYHDSIKVEKRDILRVRLQNWDGTCSYRHTNQDKSVIQFRPRALAVDVVSHTHDKKETWYLDRKKRHVPYEDFDPNAKRILLDLAGFHWCPDVRIDHGLGDVTFMFAAYNLLS